MLLSCSCEERAGEEHQGNSCKLTFDITYSLELTAAVCHFMSPSLSLLQQQARKDKKLSTSSNPEDGKGSSQRAILVVVGKWVGVMLCPGLDVFMLCHALR